MSPNALYILIAALCIYALGYRFYSKWIAAKVLVLNDLRATPSVQFEDGKDFVKTNKWIVFGHHFAAISGPGPLVGPVLAAQFGYLPGTLWILIGVVLGGAVQDFLILVFSMRRKGKSIAEMVKEEIGTTAGMIATIAVLSIMVILIAVLGLVVVKALAHSPWGSFTILATIPIALFMGVMLRFIRPGKVGEVTLIGIILLLLAVWGGQFFHEDPTLASWMTFSGKTLAGVVILYGLAASILPVWLLLAPRDYLSTFMKLGTIGALALGLFFVMPKLQFPALTSFIDGTGPVFSGKLFPFCFITIACGAISGFHSLIASGTTPKMILKEKDARAIGYGSMLLESFVAIMALIAACTLEPGVYFSMNSPAAIVGETPEQVSETITSWGYPVTAFQMENLAKDVGETSLYGRVGGAPTLAVGMAHLFSSLIGGKGLMALWYHFAIMFEALFILTTVDAGTRVGRFLLQAALGHLWKPLGNLQSYPANIFSSALLVSAWGYFLYQGVIDPLGGINSLWPLFGIANQLLSVVALCLIVTVLLKMGKKRYAWIALIPLLWLVTVTYNAGLQKIFHPNEKIGFLKKATLLQHSLDHGPEGIDWAPGAEEEMRRTIFNLHLNAIVAGFFLALVFLIVIISVFEWIKILKGRGKSLKEEPIHWLSKPPSLIHHQSLLKDEQKTGREWAQCEEERFIKPKCC